jgi:hypothetical protein
MSQAPPKTASSSSSNFRPIFNAALEDYKKKTKNDLLQHGLAAQLERCGSATAILEALDKQYHVQQFIQSQTDGGSSKQWLSATATVLCAFSAALGEGVGLVNFWSPIVDDLPSNPVPQVFSPAKVIFAGVGVLLIVRYFPW